MRLLQTELAQLGLTVPDAEWLRAFFGPGTQEAVGASWASIGEEQA